MVQKQIKNIIFDFGGILVDLDKPRCLEAFNRLGFPEASQWIDAYCQQGIFGKLETGEITPESFCDEVRRLTGCQASDTRLWEAWNLFLAGIPRWRIEALMELRKHYVVYLLSNTNAPHWEYACSHFFPHKGFQAEDYFEEMFLSYQLHQAKPSEDIFRTVLQRTGVVPDETLFIDDSAANCHTARSLGIHTYCPAPGEDWRKALGLTVSDNCGTNFTL